MAAEWRSLGTRHETAFGRGDLCADRVDTRDEYGVRREFCRGLSRTVAVYRRTTPRFERWCPSRHFGCTEPGDDARKRVRQDDLVWKVYQARHHAPSDECLRFDARVR